VFDPKQSPKSELTPRAENSVDQWGAVDLPEAIQVTPPTKTHRPETPLTQGVPIELCTLSRGEFGDRFIEERPYPPIGTIAKSKQWKQLMKNYDCPYDVYDSNGLLLFCGVCHASYKSCATMAIGIVRMCLTTLLTALYAIMLQKPEDILVGTASGL